MNDDAQTGESELTELASVDLPPVTPGLRLTQLDHLEETVVQRGQQLLRRLCALQWEELDAAAVARYRQSQTPATVVADGYETVTAARRCGTLRRRRQICVDPQTHTPVMPGNTLLLDHHGRLSTRGWAEWACLLSHDLPFATVARLLGWQTGEPGVLSATMGRTLVRDHGDRLRRVERSRALSLLQHPPLGGRRLQGVPQTPRHRTGWPQAL